MGTRVTEAMIDGWTWEKNTLVSPNGRLHVVCSRSSYENRDGSHRTLWSADAYAAGRGRIDGWEHTPREYGGRVGGSTTQPTRRAAAVEALDSVFRTKEADRLPADADVVGLHPDFARRLREAHAAHAAKAAKAAADHARVQWENLQRQLAELPRRIEVLEDLLPRLRLRADQTDLLRAQAYEDHQEAERLVLCAIANAMDAEWRSGTDTRAQAQWLGWAAGWRDGRDRGLDASQRALAAAQQVQADCKVKLTHAAELAVTFAEEVQP